MERLTGKAIHGVFYHQTEGQGYDTDGSFAWLTDGRFRAETEGLVIAAQDGLILMRRYMRDVLHVTVDPTCRLCRKGVETIRYILSSCESHQWSLLKERVETIGHILSSCESHQWSLLKERHDRVVYRLMMSLAKRLNVTVPRSMTWGLTG